MSEQEQVVLIHTMGKVGSTSVMKSLQSLDRNIKVYHTHCLKPESLQRQIEKKEKLGQPIKGHLKDSQEFSQLYLNSPEKLKNVKIITLVREPISRNISGFFENIELFFPNFTDKYSSGELKIEQIIDSFLENYNHHIPLTWLDLEIRDLFGIDVFLQEFPKDKGYLIWRQPVNLLLIKLENLNECFSTAVENFMNIDGIKLEKANDAKNKSYEQAYRQFKQSIILPKEYINAIYNSQYASHFFGDSKFLAFIK